MNFIERLSYLLGYKNIHQVQYKHKFKAILKPIFITNTKTKIIPYK